MRSHARLPGWPAPTRYAAVAAICGEVKIAALVVHHDAGRLQALPVQRSTGTDGQARQDAGTTARRPAPRPGCIAPLCGFMRQVVQAAAKRERERKDRSGGAAQHRCTRFDPMRRLCLHGAFSLAHNSKNSNTVYDSSSVTAPRIRKK
ncbi:hypothetical protein ACU4GD_08980, partial [Cupriavidus basilensis]